MADHFRSSEGQDDMAQAQPDAMAYEQQPDVAYQAAQASPLQYDPASAEATAYQPVQEQAPLYDNQTAAYQDQAAAYRDQAAAYREQASAYREQASAYQAQAPAYEQAPAEQPVYEVSPGDQASFAAQQAYAAPAYAEQPAPTYDAAPSQMAYERPVAQYDATVAQPAYEQPAYEQPAAQPTYEAVQYEAPATRPAYEQPAAQPAAFNAGAQASFAAQAAYAVEPAVQANTPDASQLPDPLAPVAPAPAPEPVQAAPAAEAAYDPSQEAGFTTTFAPITSQSGSATAQVNNGGVPVISFQGVSVVYPAQPNKPALSNVDVDVYAGEFVFLVGHSGSGKSTFLKLVTRELKPTEGRVMVAGQDLTSMRNWKVPYLRRQIGCVFQDFKLLPDKTIFDNVAFALECIGKPRSVIKAQVPEVLRLVGLGEKMDVYPDQLSGGEQQRVSVARAMVNRPPLLVCDEPTGNLDPAISLGIMKLLERINRTGTTILMATHDREMVDSMRKRVIALEAGHVVRDQEKGGYGYYGAV